MHQPVEPDRTPMRMKQEKSGKRQCLQGMIPKAVKHNNISGLSCMTSLDDNHPQPGSIGSQYGKKSISNRGDKWLMGICFFFSEEGCSNPDCGCNDDKRDYPEKSADDTIKHASGLCETRVNTAEMLNGFNAITEQGGVE